MSSLVSVVFSLAGVTTIFLYHQHDHENSAQEPDSAPETQHPTWKYKSSEGTVCSTVLNPAVPDPKSN